MSSETNEPQQTIKLTIEHNAEWVNQRSLELGRNVEDKTKIDFEISKLSLASRALIYCERLRRFQRDLSYGEDFMVNDSVSYGELHLLINSTEPTAEQIDSALQVAFADLGARREEWLRKKKLREQQEETKRRTEEEQKRKVKEARELLADEIAASKKNLDELKSLVNDLWLVCSHMQKEDVQAACDEAELETNRFYEECPSSFDDVWS